MISARLTADNPPGWYECRFLRNGPGQRVARWWNGVSLCSTSQLKHVGDCAVGEYTDFIGPLVPSQAPVPLDGLAKEIVAALNKDGGAMVVSYAENVVAEILAAALQAPAGELVRRDYAGIASRIRDITRRIGPAAHHGWIISEFEQLANLLDVWGRPSSEFQPTPEER